MMRDKFFQALTAAVFSLCVIYPSYSAGGNSSNIIFGEEFKHINAEHENSRAGTRGLWKPEYVDRGDFYYLNTGEKKSFLRDERTYLLIRDTRTATPAISPEIIKSRFGDRLDIVKDKDLGGNMKVRVKEGEDPEAVLSALRQADPTVSFISPFLRSHDKGGDIAVAPYIIVSIDNSFGREYVISELMKYGLSKASALSFTMDEVEMKINMPHDDIKSIFQLTRTVADLPFVNWAEPNLIVSIQKQFIPDDTYFTDQWHLHNTGQNGAAVDADIDAPEGWDTSQGSGTVIAIYDDGVDTSHEDLIIWSNPGETGGGKETNGEDDDGNGYVDDYQGWDFTDNDKYPDPALSSDNHGTSVAGVAGAVGNNALGVSGSAPGALILPVRMTSGFCSTFGNAMRYAGKYADVVNNSWTIGACESSLNSAISDVVNGTITGARRGTKGSPVLFATGNSASGWIKFTLSGISAGTHTFRWRFFKDITVSSGYDTVWLDDITWPGGAITDFEGDTIGVVPSGFTSGGDADWAVVSDGTHARGASGKSVKAGTITHSQETYLDSTRAVGSGSLTFWVWVSSEQNYDFWEFYFNGTRYFQYAPGQNGHSNSVGYPASNQDTIAVGASNDGGISGLEERSYYSQFGNEVDVVAPSSGGGQGISTTDRMGNPGYNGPGPRDDGYSDSNYTNGFGGTSSATPLVAGIVADIVAYSSHLTAAELRTTLHNSADKIGPYAYPGGRNDYYGYGRVNLSNALCSDSDGDGYTTCGGDCDDGDGLEFPGQTWYEDVDGDLYSSGDIIVQCERPVNHYVSGELTATSGDCNDNTASINPGAADACDGNDNDCNAGTPDGSGEIAPDNTKQDGVCLGSKQSCTGGSWLDDYSGVSSYEADELSCDGLDNDCDTQTDEGLTTTYYLDSDGDTYGDLGNTVDQCSLPTGYVLDNTDCDDGDANIYPGGPLCRPPIIRLEMEKRFRARPKP
jgi:subtilisin family serine protease